MTVLWFKIPLIALLWRCPPLFHCSYWYLHTATTSSPLPPPSPAPLCPSVSAVPELGPQSHHCTLSLMEPAGSVATASSYKTDVASWWNCLREAKIAGEMGRRHSYLWKRMLLTNRDFFQSVYANQTQTSDGLLISAWWEHSCLSVLMPPAIFFSHFSTWMNWYLHRLITQTLAISHMPVDWSQKVEYSEIMKRCLWTNHWIYYQLFFLLFLGLISLSTAMQPFFF